MDCSDFGSFGVLRFMRRHEETVIASYPIDEHELTFGCDPSCSVRLYYPTVSPLHAKIFFQEHKAFIEVFGVHGLLIDKCQVFPASTTTHTTVPLSNNSELEINKKRFRFEYPPKALRPVLAFTPPPPTSSATSPKPKRVLRLSMIQSAQVFTPRPDPDPRVNLRVLQTPIRLNSSPLKGATTARTREQADQGGYYNVGIETPIRLVEGNRPHVVEEEQDLVILEEVEAPTTAMMQQQQQQQVNPGQSSMSADQQIQMQNGAAAPAFPLPPSYQSQQLQTPRRRPARPSLHRAVLIRSAQRAAMRVEMEKEQEEEEREVEEHVMPDEEEHMQVDEEALGGTIIAEEEGELEEPVTEWVPRPTTPVFGWRNGLAAFKDSLQAFRSRSKSPEKNEHTEREFAEATANHEGEPLEQDEELRESGDEILRGHAATRESTIGIQQGRQFQFTPQRPPQRPLAGAAFMTPQVQKSNAALSLADRVRGRKSTGGVGRTTWLITNTDVAAIPNADQNTPRSENLEPGQRRVSASEKQAIQERRRSALVQPDPFFGGNIPGSRRNSLGSVVTPRGAKAASSNFVSPSKTCDAIKEDEEEAETSTLLEKMKEVVEGMQRRRSVGTSSDAAILELAGPEESGSGEDDAGQREEVPEDDEAIAVEEPFPVPPPPVDARPTFPATPRMSDLKHVFSERRAANAVAPTSYAGVRQLFRMESAATYEPETPRLDGLREMRARASKREPDTPLFEGVGEMLATPPEYAAVAVQGPSENDEETEEMESTTGAVPAPKRSRGKKAVISKSGAKKAAAAPAREGCATPTEREQLADDELTPDDPPLAKPSKHSANAPKGSIVRRTTRRAENEPKESVSRGRKGTVTSQVREQPPPSSELERAPARRSRTTTKSTESTAESEPAESSKSTRKTKRGAKAVAATPPEPEPEPEPAKSLRRTAKRSQSIEVVVPAAPTMTKRRTAAKSKARETSPDVSTDAAVERAGPPSEARPAAARVRRTKTKSAAETEEENVVVGASRTARGRRTPPTTATTTAAAPTIAGAALNRAAAAGGATGKVRATATSTAKGVHGQTAAGEKENTPEMVKVKEEEEEGERLPVVVKGPRVRRAAAPSLKATQSEPEKKDATVTVAAKASRGSRTRAASTRK